MKIKKPQTVKVTSDVPESNVTVMSISADGMQHIMDRLTNLYKDPELAIIREYYTNGLDAHMAAGVDSPVHVTLPTWDAPTYVVQDFGIGMTEQDIKEIYAQYGASTKRTSDDYIGAFGLGCKCALTLTQQFTLVSIKNGIKTAALISKADSGVNTVTIVASAETDEPNGTTVKIPVKDYASVASKAHQFFSYSTAEDVLVNGNPPKHNAYEDMIKVFSPTDESNFYISPDGWGTSYVVMGKVPYAITMDEIEESVARIGEKNNRAFVTLPKIFEAHIGDIELTPNREGLIFSELTKEFIDNKMKFLLKDLEPVAQRELDSVTDLREFYKSSRAWESILGKKMNTWNGKEIARYLEAKDEPIRRITRSVSGSADHMTTRRLVLDFSYDTPTVIVDGLKDTEYTKVNRYLTNYMKHEDLNDAYFLFTVDTGITENELVLKHPSFKFVKPEEIIEKSKAQKKLETPAGPRTKKENHLEYPVWFLGSSTVDWISSEDIEPGTPYFRTELGDIGHLIKASYGSWNGLGRNVSKNVSEALKLLTGADEVILMGGVRTVAALEKRIKGTYNLMDDIVKAESELQDEISEELIEWLAIKDNFVGPFLKSADLEKDIKKIQDPLIRSVVVPPKKLTDSYKQVEDKIKALKFVRSFNSPINTRVSQCQTPKKLENKYKLLKIMWSSDIKRKGAKDHVIQYLNMVHANSQIDEPLSV